jgi:hypothetical protein
MPFATIYSGRNSSVSNNELFAISSPNTPMAIFLVITGVIVIIEI